MTPDEIVARLMDIASMNPDMDEDEILERLIAEGVPGVLAYRAYRFTQIACGRVFLQGNGITFPLDWVGFNANGVVIEEGLIEEEPFYVAAMNASSRYIGGEAFMSLALSSADVDVVNNALHGGSKMENLVMAPPFVFLEPSTESGYENCKRVVNERMAAIRQQLPPKPGVQAKSEPRRPWQFWKR